MNPRDAEGYLEFAYRMALAAGEAILPHFREIIDVEDKRNVMGYDPVTIADRAAEEVIRAEIIARIPTMASMARNTASTAARLLSHG